MEEKNNKDLEQLNAKINELKEVHDRKKNKDNVGKGANILIEISTAIILGFAFGWYLDSYLNTKPLCIIICTVLSFIAGIRQLMRK